MFLAVLLAASPWATFTGTAGPLLGKNVVLISGDEEYRSEESLSQLAKILARHHGAHCTVLFAIDPRDGTINPNVNDNIPGLEALASADLMVIATRFRDLPEGQMRRIAAYVDSRRPIIGLRTATHAFKVPPDKPFAEYSYDSPYGGFGRRVLGETWIGHHGRHGEQGTRGIVVPEAASHPVLRGIHDREIFGSTDVYSVQPPADCRIVLRGEVTASLDPKSPAAAGQMNSPMMPVAWVRTKDGRRVFTCTMGASQDFANAGLRRLFVNACYWAMGLEDRMPSSSAVDLVGEYRPTPFGFDKFTKGIRPADLESK